MTTGTLKETRSIFRVDKATSKNYLANHWIYVAPLIVSGLNHANDIPEIYKWISEDIDAMDDLNANEKLALKAKVVAKQRDALLKGIIPYGYPKTIMGTQALYDATPQEIKDLLPKEPIRKDSDWESVQAHRKRGDAFFDHLYDSGTDKMKAKLSEIYPDLGQSINHSAYSSLLSEVSVTSEKETSIVLVAGCFSLQLTPLLIPHIGGAKINGTTDQELDEIFDFVRATCAFYGAPAPVLPEQV